MIVKLRNLAISWLAIIVVYMFHCQIVRGQTPQDGTTVIHRVVLLDSLPAYGLTICDTLRNQPLVLINMRIAGTPQFRQILRHESVHVQQAAIYPGGCKASAQRYFVDAEFRFSQELEAYCTSLQDDPSFDTAIETLTFEMWRSYGSSIPIDLDETRSRVNQVCRNPQVKAVNLKPP